RCRRWSRRSRGSRSLRRRSRRNNASVQLSVLLPPRQDPPDVVAGLARAELGVELLGLLAEALAPPEERHGLARAVGGDRRHRAPREILAQGAEIGADEGDRDLGPVEVLGREALEVELRREAAGRAEREMDEAEARRRVEHRGVEAALLAEERHQQVR